MKATLTHHSESSMRSPNCYQGEPINTFDSALVHTFLRADDLNHQPGMESLRDGRQTVQSPNLVTCMHHAYALAMERGRREKQIKCRVLGSNIQHLYV